MKMIKTQKTFIYLICFLALLSSIKSLSTLIQGDIQTNAHNARAVTLENGNVLVVSSEEGDPQNIHVAELDKDGRILYSGSKIARGISPDAQLVQQKNSDLYFVSHHNKQNLPTSDPSEYLFSFKEKAASVNAYLRANKKLYQKTSLVALKNGRILVAGILPDSTFGEITKADVAIFNPNTKTFSPGESMCSPWRTQRCEPSV